MYLETDDRSVGQTAADALVASAITRIETRLGHLLRGDEFAPVALQEAMAHAVLGGGKRIRPLMLIFMTSQNELREAVLDAGCAVEMIHAASLILDDLPCMDDATTRRGRVTTHLQFGQSTAILGAISLLTRSMSVLSGLEGVSAATRSRLVAILSNAVGQCGLAGGQELDVSGTNISRLPAEIEQVNWLKTGKLFAAIAEIAGLLGRKTEEQRTLLATFAHHLGAAFQTYDDYLDATASQEEAGKDIQKDAAKATLVSVLGFGQARMSCREHLRLAEIALVQSDVNADPIRLILKRCLPLETLGEAANTHTNTQDAFAQ